MKKIRTLLKAPVLTQSGYGVHSRQIFKALSEDPTFDLFVENINWGATSYLTEDSAEKRSITQHMEKRVIEKHRTEGKDQYDLFIHVTIPNEFEKLGRVNVGVTAGIETDKVSHVWVQKCQEMDLIVVPSEHSRKVLCETEVEWENQKTKERGVFKLEKPVVVCNEGVDCEIFKPFDLVGGLAEKLDLEADFNFLHVGQWGRGGYGEDRKNIASLVRYFIEAFKGRDDVGLVLKINMARSSIVDYQHTLNRLREVKSNFKPEEVPPIHLLHGNLTNDEMAELYNHPKIGALVSLTHGEGFGLPLLEAAACGLPILATNWSGHLDFLKKGSFSPIQYEMKEIPDVAVWENILIKGSKWAEVDEGDTKRRMKKMVSSSTKPKLWAKDLAKKVKEEFDVPVVCQSFADTIKLSLQQDAPMAAKADPKELMSKLVDTPDDFNVIYTMPMSAGDVFISTAVIDGLVKDLPENAKIYFATSEKYADILKGNPHIHKVIPYFDFMMHTELLEDVFDLALMPNTTTQYNFSNYVRRGQGRLLAEEFANYCICELGDYHILTDDSVFSDEGFNMVIANPTCSLVINDYITVHPGSGEGQWGARNYIEWQEVTNNLKRLYPELKIVQVGMKDEPALQGVDVDARGKTDVHKLASLISHSLCHLSIDTFTMHLAAGLDTPLVALFGSSHARSSGPWCKDKESARHILLEAEQKLGCNKACYKYECKKNKAMPCINEIDPRQVVAAMTAVLGKKHGNEFENFEAFPYERVFGKISGYTTAYNLKGYPFAESINSMLGFCDEVVVLDGCSDDGTYETLEAMAAKDDRIQLYQNPWDFEEPGIDGMQKAFARALCSNEFLWQQDCDEVVHEDDYEKIKMITKRFPSDADILHLPIIEIWGNPQCVTGRRHAWKWRMSRNKPEITHGINKDARVTDEKTGKVFAKQGMSDGCEYVNTMTYESMPHTGFYNSQIEMIRLHAQDQYADGINEVFEVLPSVFHYSWCSLEGKIKNFRDKWDKQWNALYQTDGTVRFPDVETDEQVKELSDKLFEDGGEESDAVKYKFDLRRSNPACMKDWLSKVPVK